MAESITGSLFEGNINEELNGFINVIKKAKDESKKPVIAKAKIEIDKNSIKDLEKANQLLERFNELNKRGMQGNKTAANFYASNKDDAFKNLVSAYEYSSKNKKNYSNVKYSADVLRAIAGTSEAEKMMKDYSGGLFDLYRDLTDSKTANKIMNVGRFKELLDVMHQLSEVGVDLKEFITPIQDVESAISGAYAKTAKFDFEKLFNTEVVQNRISELEKSFEKLKNIDFYNFNNKQQSSVVRQLEEYKQYFTDAGKEVPKIYDDIKQRIVANGPDKYRLNNKFYYDTFAADVHLTETGRVRDNPSVYKQAQAELTVENDKYNESLKQTNAELEKQDELQQKVTDESKKKKERRPEEKAKPEAVKAQEELAQTAPVVVDAHEQQAEAAEKAAVAEEKLADAERHASAEKDKSITESPAQIEQAAVADANLGATTEKTTEKVLKERDAIANLLGELQKLYEIKRSGNDTILPRYSDEGYLQSGLLHDKDIRNNRISKNAVKTQLKEYNDGHSDLDTLSAYVAAYGNLEEAESVFGKKNAELWAQVIDNINRAKAAAEAYENSQINESILSGYLNRENENVGVTYGDIWGLEGLLKKGGVDKALEHLTEKFGVLNAAEQAIVETESTMLDKTEATTASYEQQAAAAERVAEADSKLADAQNQINDAQSSNAASTVIEAQKDAATAERELADAKQESAQADQAEQASEKERVETKKEEVAVTKEQLDLAKRSVEQATEEKAKIDELANAAKDEAEAKKKLADVDLSSKPKKGTTAERSASDSSTKLTAEANAFDNINRAATEASAAKLKFVSNNELLKQKTEASTAALKEEISALDELAKKNPNGNGGKGKGGGKRKGSGGNSGGNPPPNPIPPTDEDVKKTQTHVDTIYNYTLDKVKTTANEVGDITRRQSKTTMQQMYADQGKAAEDAKNAALRNLSEFGSGTGFKYDIDQFTNKGRSEYNKLAAQFTDWRSKYLTPGTSDFLGSLSREEIGAAVVALRELNGEYDKLVAKENQAKQNNIWSDIAKIENVLKKTDKSKLTDEQRDAYDVIEAEIEQIKKNAKDINFNERFGGAAGDIEKAEKGIRRCADATRDLNKAQKDSMKVAIGKDIVSLAAKFFTLHRVFSKVQSSFNEGVKVFKSYDAALTNIKYTMDMTSSGFDRLGKSTVEMARTLNMSIDNAMQISQIYANMQTTSEEILSIGQPTAILSNLTGVSASEAANQIQSVMQQFKLPAEEAEHIVDVYDKISASIKMDYAKGISNISSGVKAAGSVAYDAGLSFEQLAAVIAKTSERTREEGSAIGQAVKTIAVRISKASKLSGADEVDNETLSNASKSLHDVGVEVYNADGSFRQLDVILGELSKKWDTLTDAQQANISFNVAA